jgi:anti-anti-sigma factor
MQVFLSWSGNTSREVAEALKESLLKVFPNLSVWMSEHDLEAGIPWVTELHEQLQQADFGVLCVTAENIEMPWMLYEAGALAISSTTGCVVPYLLDVDPVELLPPLSLFQSVRTDLEGTWKIVKSINQAASGILSDRHLLENFEQEWPNLANRLGISIHTELKGDILVVTPTGLNLVFANDIDTFRKKLKAILKTGQKRIIIDLIDVKKVSSSFAGCLVAGLVYKHREEGEVIFANASSSVMSLFEVTNLSDIVHVFPTLDEAINYFDDQQGVNNQ